MKRFSMSSKKCTDCKIISYPELYKYGFFNIGQKLLLGFDLILDLYNAMLTGTPIIQYLQLKLDLLSQTFEGTKMKANLKNISLNIEQCAVSILSLLITEDCMNSKVCLVCGRVAYRICTDGNVKNASKIQDNMFFEKNSDPLYDLQEFKSELAINTLTRNFFQNVERVKINMFKVFCLSLIHI